jgi:hypothetical protein
MKSDVTPSVKLDEKSDRQRDERFNFRYTFSVLGLLLITIACHSPLGLARPLEEKQTKVHSGETPCEKYLPSVGLCVAIAFDTVTDKEFYFDMVFWDPMETSEKIKYVKFPDTHTHESITYQFGVYPYMASMGHGSRNDKSIRWESVRDSTTFGSQDNIYRVGPIEFVMGGPWQLRVLYGLPEDGHMPNSTEWTIFESVEFPVTVPW